MRIESMNAIQAIAIAILQGATELFPVSSLGHAVVLPALLGWSLPQHSQTFLPFLVFLHLGTAGALLLYFWRDWWALFSGVIGFAPAHHVPQARRIFMLLVVATLPAIVVGGLLEHMLRALFESAPIAAFFLVVNGGLLLFGEKLRGAASPYPQTSDHEVTERRALSTLTVMDAFTIGCWQCAALIPGISRSGATIVGGLLRGIDHEASAHFSFLIALPIILGATVLEVPKLLHADIAPGVFQTAALAAVAAGITAWLSTAFLMRYFRDHDSWALKPFAFYCIIAGLGALAWLHFA
ncbi:Bacitracin resistance protein (Putative undecaprenol kinase) [Granulibacter bethesdensis CGDNIH4]|nr:Bacitracin resistance protein (Putative undecaprenol kinase) [Granulibacter bethesdensis CGDNIH4]